MEQKHMVCHESHSKSEINEVRYGHPHIFPFQLGKKRFIITSGLPEAEQLEATTGAKPELIVAGNADTLLSEYLTNHYQRKHAKKLSKWLNERGVEVDETAVNSIVCVLQAQLIDSPNISLVSVLKDFYDGKELPPAFNLLTALFPPYKIKHLQYAFNFDHLFNETKEIKLYSLSPNSGGKLFTRLLF